MIGKGFQEYLTYEKRFSKHTVEAYLNDLAQFSGYLNDLEIEHYYFVTTQTVRSWVVSLVEQGLSPSTLHRKMSSVNTFYKYLLKKGEVNTNPIKGIQLPKLPQRLPKFIEQKDIEELMSNLEADSKSFASLRDRLVFELFYATGIRRQELIALSWTDVDFSSQQLKIFGKGGKERNVPIGKALIELLQEYHQVCQKAWSAFNDKGRVILTDKGKPAYPSLIYRIVNSGLKSVNVKTQKSPHALRHTFATHLLNEGAPLNDIKELLGHASLASTQIYTHNSIEKLKQVFKRSHPKA